MPIIRRKAPIQCLVAVRGHPFDRTAFDEVFQAMDGISAIMVDQPAAVSSRLVYLQPGDGPSVYDDANYRRLVENAIRWVA
jgi:hypothetical protein